jgi:hypothetical protein
MVLSDIPLIIELTIYQFSELGADGIGSPQGGRPYEGVCNPSHCRGRSLWRCEDLNKWG